MALPETQYLICTCRGQSLAGRQYAWIIDTGESWFSQVYRRVYEFKMKFLDKAIVYSQGGVKSAEWAAFMVGGSLTNLPLIRETAFLRKPLQMRSKKNLNPG
jgi:hypothetical protein